MLTPEKMSRLLIVASKEQLVSVTQELYRSRLFHIEDYVVDGREGYDGFSIGTPLEGASEASGDLVKIRSIANAFAIVSDDVEPVSRQRQADMKKMIEQEFPAVEREVTELNGRKAKLEALIKEYEQKINEITPFALIPTDLSMYSGYERFSVLAGYVARNVAIKEPAEYRIVKGKTNLFLVAVVPNEHRGDVERQLQEAGFTAVPIPAGSGMPQNRIEEYKAQIGQARAEIESITLNLDAIRQKRTGFFVACEEVLKAEVEQAEAPLRFATTDQTFVAEGWVPAASAAKISESVMKATGGKAFVTELPIGAHDVVPVEYDNPPFAKPSQVLLDVYSRPKYTELDPTLMISIIFPIFFGLILGDVGYGLILLAMALALRRVIKGEEGKYLITVLRNASISSIIFGILYSEFLGFPCPWSPVLFSRHLNIGAHATGHGPKIPELMILAVWIGILHITLGRILGIVNHSRQDHGDHRIKAMLANLGWILVMWGILAVIWSIVKMPIMPDFTGMPAIVSGLNTTAIIGAAMIVVGVVFIARDSALEIVELPTIISNVLSYARIVAVGLSSVAIAMVINYIALGMMIEPQLENLTLFGVVFILMGVAVFLIGHLLNTALGVLGGGLHSIRLHYVEFFTKFYKGGGVKYNPFGLKRRFTED
jgi:V/A-type H+-transporting ATPase subunit I